MADTHAEEKAPLKDRKDSAGDAAAKPKEGEKHPIILMAIDHSQQAIDAFEWYYDYIHRPENRLLLIHVAEPPTVPSNTMYVAPEVFNAMVDEAKVKATELEEDFAKKMKERGMQGRIRAVFHHRPGEAVIEISKEEKVNMIVTGTRGMGSIRRTILGSVSDYILHHAHCPVVICRHAHEIVHPEDAKHPENAKHK